MTYLKSSLLSFLLLIFVQCGVQSSMRPDSRSPASAGRTEAAEFAELFAKDQHNKSAETAEVLNYLLNDEESSDPNTAIVLENLSDCDMIVRAVMVAGNQIYNLPVPRNGKNHFVIKKGNYTLKSNVCTSKYYSQKTIVESAVIKISIR